MEGMISAKIKDEKAAKVIFKKIPVPGSSVDPGCLSRFRIFSFLDPHQRIEVNNPKICLVFAVNWLIFQTWNSYLALP